jgi:hypothetical protein
MLNRLQNTRTAVVLSAVTNVLFLERVLLDFRYVSLEMEAVDAIMPFTAPYMGISLIIFGAWLWGLLAAVQDKRGAFITLLLCNSLALLLGVSTLAFLCPTPCQTGAPLADVLDWSMSLVALVAIVSAGMVFFGNRQTIQAVEKV